MIRQTVKSISFIVLLFLYVAAAQASVETDYAQGVELFKKGNYEAAIVKFESANNQGMKSPSLYYNLGSAYFKLENYSVSKTYYMRVAEYPDKRALAEYNLGLIAIKQNNKAEALRHFNYVVSTSSENMLVKLSKQQIARLKATVNPWAALFAVNYGYDDNINVTPNDVTQGISDTFYNIYAKADVVVFGKRRNGWLLDTSYFRIDFSDTDEYDQDFYTIGLRSEYRLSGWDTKVHLSSGESTFGGDDLQSFYKLDLLGARPLSSKEKIILRYRYDDYTSEKTVYDYLEGWRQRAQIMYYRNTAKNNQQLYYEAELNDRGDLVTSTYSYNYSPVRQTVRGKYTHKFTDAWHLTGDLSYRTSDFPASTTIDRDESKWTGGLALDYRIDNALIIKGNVKYMENESSVDTYDYDKTVVTLGVSKLF